MFYVGLTRHVKKAEFYISESDSKYLSDLKRQAFQTNIRDSTLDYQTQSELNRDQMKSQQNKKIEQLKSSESFTKKIKGWGLSGWDGMRSKTSEIVEKYNDRKSNQAFFNPNLEKNEDIGKGVKEVLVEEEISINRKEIQSEFKRALEVSENTMYPKTVKSTNRVDWSEFPESKRNVFSNYFKSIDKASLLYTIVKSEEKGERSAYFQDWQEACKDRNALAYEVLRSFKLKELRTVLKGKSLEILQERSTKHDMQLQRKENSLIDLDTKLKENMDSLLHKLFPEGPTRKDSKGLRFGAKGSLVVTCTGSKTGSFFDFENQEGGGPIQLIQKRLFSSQPEAIAWAKDFLGASRDLPVPTQFSFQKNMDKEQEWVSLKPNPNKPAPSLKETSKGLSFNYTETARYTYRDEDGKELFHVLRLEDKQQLGKKIVLPLSYGYYKGNEEDAQWSLKGYQSEKRPLYNQQLLKEHPNAKVLIVEGEKAADAASKIFPREKIICLTWSGGAGAVSKSDWKPLRGRDAIIWPDNDKAGFEASDSIYKELREIGVKSLREVDRLNHQVQSHQEKRPDLLHQRIDSSCQ
nr:hypothetical protein [Chlamydiales bacterium]